jgi:hypothetical protein
MICGSRGPLVVCYLPVRQVDTDDIALLAPFALISPFAAGPRAARDSPAPASFSGARLVAMGPVGYGIGAVTAAGLAEVEHELWPPASLKAQ